MAESTSDHTTATEYDADRLYLDLKGARERLCRAQTFVPAHWQSDLSAAMHHVDLCGSALFPGLWSVENQPEYPERHDG